MTILTGFLGSGKTTVLNRLLKLPRLADTAVIVDELGEVGIDHLLIEQAIENTLLLKNGCICCSLRGDIADTLETLWDQRARSVIPPFARIVIETTGLADPGPVAHALIAAPGAGFACRLDGIVTTVDAVHGLLQLDRQDEARQQVALADRILLTKTDLADGGRAAAVERRIAQLNGTAPVRRVIAGDADADDVFGLGPATGRNVAAWLAAPHDHGHAHDEIAALVLRHDAPIALPALRAWLNSLLSIRGADVLRVKGVVQLAGAAQPLVLQGVHHVLHPPLRLERWPFHPPRTEIVLITRGLSATGLRASFAAAMEMQP